MTNGIGTEIKDIKGKFYTFFVDGREFHVEESSLTGAAIMQIPGIPSDAGLILVQEDGTQVQVKRDDVIQLEPGRRFKKAPRFVRG